MSSIYGDNIFIKDNLVNKVTDSMINFGSLAYNEYLNYKSMLENCIDDSSRPILEAKVEVLQEIGVKDIWEKIKEAFRKLVQMIKDLFNKIKSFFKNKKIKNLEKEVSDLKSKLKEKEKETQEAASKVSSSEGEVLTTKKAFDELMSKYESLKKSSTEKLQAERDRAEWLNDKYDDIKHKYINLNKENKTNLDKINLANLRLAKALAELASNPAIYFDVFDYTKGGSPTVYHIGKAMQSAYSRIMNIQTHIRDKNKDKDFDDNTTIKSSLTQEDKEWIDNYVEEIKELNSDILNEETVKNCKAKDGNKFTRLEISNLYWYIDKNLDQKCEKYCKVYSKDVTKFLEYLETVHYASQASMIEGTLSSLDKSVEEVNHIIIGLSNNSDSISAEAIKVLSATKEVLLNNVQIAEQLSKYATRCYGAVGSSILAVKALMVTE